MEWMIPVGLKMGFGIRSKGFFGAQPLQQILKKIYKAEHVVGTRFFHQNIKKHQQKTPVDGDGC